MQGLNLHITITCKDKNIYECLLLVRTKMSRRGSRSLLTSPAGQNANREKSPSMDEKGDNEEKRNQRRNKLFRRIQMDIKVHKELTISSH